MSRDYGMWIDHRKAIIVLLAHGAELIQEVESGMEPHIRPSGGARSKVPYGPQDAICEDGRERKFRLHLARYYEQVADHLWDADSILVFGPGLAKQEFVKHLKGRPLYERIVGVETTDKMSTRQIAAKVREYYHWEAA